MWLCWWMKTLCLLPLQLRCHDGCCGVDAVAVEMDMVAVMSWW